MKSFGGLYTHVCSMENLYRAASKARKRKTRKENVERFELHRERFLKAIRQELMEECWRPSAYRCFLIYEPKTRTISAAPYRDRVVHHALCNVIGPLIERRFIDDSFSCRKGKGTQAGRDRCRHYTNRYRFALKCDVRKYFESIDHDILLAKLGRLIRCASTHRLCRLIIESSKAEGAPPVWEPGDDLLAPADRLRGLPIGNLTSQLWANFYLDRMDHVVREQIRPGGYVRYTDDFVLWSDDRDFLHDARERIGYELRTERLQLHPVKTRVFPVRCGVPFLGFRFFPGRAPRLLGGCKRRFERRMRAYIREVAAGRLDMADVRCSASGWQAFADYGNVRGLYRHYRREKFG